VHDIVTALIAVAGTLVIGVSGLYAQRKSGQQQHDLSMYDRVLARNSELEDEALELRREHNKALDQIDYLLGSIREKDRKIADLSSQINERHQ
jgi:hypothetical protein